MKATNKTWNEFWGKFIMVDARKNIPNRQKKIQKKADWIWANGILSGHPKILDLGCGPGVIDICLAKMGANIVAIDWIESVIKIAKEEARGLSVEFLADDIRNVSYPDNSFDCILIIETVGSMSKEDDLDLITKSFQWLKKNGRLIIDCPDPCRAETHSHTKEYEEGVLKMEVSFNESNSIITIDPSLQTKKNETIRLYDPISMVKGEYYGFKRYLYNKEELKNILTGVGYSVNEVPHHLNDEYYAFTGTKK